MSGFIIFGIVLVLFALGAQQLYTASQERKAALQLQRWPATFGIVTASNVIEEHSGRDGFAPVVHYDYTVNGRSYTGKRIGPRAMKFRSRNAAQVVADRYPVDWVIEVHYDPITPQDAVLEPEAIGFATRGFLGALCILLAPVIGAVLLVMSY